MIYFIQAGDNGNIKIGLTDDIKRRIGELQTGSPEPLRLLATLSGDYHTEQALHAMFAHLRIQGEWFLPSPDLLNFISSRGTILPIQDTKEGNFEEWLERRRFNTHTLLIGITMMGALYSIYFWICPVILADLPPVTRVMISLWWMVVTELSAFAVLFRPRMEQNRRRKPRRYRRRKPKYTYR